MTTTTFSFASENTFLSTIARLFKPADTATGPSLMSLYRLAGTGDTVRPEAIAALDKIAN